MQVYYEAQKQGEEYHKKLMGYVRDCNRQIDWLKKYKKPDDYVFPTHAQLRNYQYRILRKEKEIDEIKLRIFELQKNISVLKRYRILWTRDYYRKLNPIEQQDLVDEKYFKEDYKYYRFERYETIPTFDCIYQFSVYKEISKAVYDKEKTV